MWDEYELAASTSCELVLDCVIEMASHFEEWLIAVLGTGYLSRVSHAVSSAWQSPSDSRVKRSELLDCTRRHVPHAWPQSQCISLSFWKSQYNTYTFVMSFDRILDDLDAALARAVQLQRPTASERSVHRENALFYCCILVTTYPPLRLCIDF